MVGIADRMTELRITDEAKRIGVELHDSLAQPVSVVALEADKALMSLDEGDFDSLRHGLTRLREASLQACDLIRQEVLTLGESVEEFEDLSDVLGRFVMRFASQWGLKISFERPDDPVMVTKKVGDQVLRILNEALGNVVRHARAKSVVVSLSQANGMLSLRVEDDGCGFDVAASERARGVHLGLSSMRSRAENIGGRFAVRSAHGRGTEVKIVLEE